MSQQYQLQQQEIRTLCRQDPDARCAFRMQVVKSRTRDVMVRISTMLNDQRIDPESVYRQMLACSRKQVEVAMHYINCWERLSEYFELIPEEQVATQN